jgi:hypothetical protein
LIRRLVTIAGCVSTLILVTPGVASAHGIGGRLDLPVPLEYFVVGAALVLVGSFAALAILWPEPRLQAGPGYRANRLVGPVFSVAAALGVLALLLVIGQLAVPLLGVETIPGRSSIAPVSVWVIFWLVIPFGGAVVGDWYTDLNPWRSLAEGLRLGTGERLELLDRLGVWPAAGALLLFTWLELVHPGSGDPMTLATAGLVYTSFLFGAMTYAGRETALAVFDLFTPYNRLISSIAPVGRGEDGRLMWRGWLRALPGIPEWAGLWFFVVAMIGTVSYDGASGTEWLPRLAGSLQDSMLGRSLLLAIAVLVIAGGYWLASLVAARLGEGNWTAALVARRFAHTLVPIALAYAVAHYATLAVFEGQQIIAAISDPFAIGWNLFGTADRRVDFFLTATEPIWYFQVASIVGGHLLGVVLAHDRALADFGAGAVRSQYAMLVLMIALTTLGLLILAG